MEGFAAVRCFVCVAAAPVAALMPRTRLIDGPDCVNPWSADRIKTNDDGPPVTQLQRLARQVATTIGFTI